MFLLACCIGLSIFMSLSISASTCASLALLVFFHQSVTKNAEGNTTQPNKHHLAMGLFAMSLGALCLINQLLPSFITAYTLPITNGLFLLFPICLVWQKKDILKDKKAKALATIVLTCLIAYEYLQHGLRFFIQPETALMNQSIIPTAYSSFITATIFIIMGFILSHSALKGDHALQGKALSAYQASLLTLSFCLLPLGGFIMLSVSLLLHSSMKNYSDQSLYITPANTGPDKNQRQAKKPAFTGSGHTLGSTLSLNTGPAQKSG